MGGACTKNTVYQPAERTTETESIDRQLDEAKAREELHFKILCLGAGESGKSTVIKQLTFIHKQQLTPEERLSYVKVLQNNTVQCMITLIKEAEAFGYSSQFSEAERLAADAVCNYDQRSDMTYELLEHIQLLWHSESITLTYSRRNEYWHLEATDYYFSNAERYVADGFIPTEEDIVMARKRTTGVVVTELDYGGVHWSCVDVGGQRSERRKWLNCFDNVKAIIYVVNLAGYCKVLFEDKAVNRMHESLNLFEATMSNPLFQHTPVFIFLNKKDLFEQLLRTQPIDCCFPDYGGSNDLHSCIEYISEEYERRLPVGRRDKPTFLLLAARMKKDVQYCFEEVKDLLLDMHKRQIGKAKKALERVEKRNRAVDGDDAEGEAEGGEGGVGQRDGKGEQKYQVRGLQGWEATRKPTKVGGGVKKPLPANMLATVKSSAGQARDEKQAAEAKAEEEEAKAGGNVDRTGGKEQPQHQQQPLLIQAHSTPSHDVSHAALIPSASNPLSTPTGQSTALPPLASHGSSGHEPSTATASYNQHDNHSSIAIQSAAAIRNGPRHSTSSNTDSTTQISHLNPVSMATNGNAHVTPTVTPRGVGGGGGEGRGRAESREGEDEWGGGRDRGDSGGGMGSGRQRIKDVEEVKENDEQDSLLGAAPASDAIVAVQQVS